MPSNISRVIPGATSLEVLDRSIYMVACFTVFSSLWKFSVSNSIVLPRKRLYWFVHRCCGGREVGRGRSSALRAKQYEK